MLDSFKNWNIFQFSHKDKSSEYIENNNQVVLGGISYRMAALVQTGKYGAINTIYITTMDYYVIKSLSEAYKLEEVTSCDRQIRTSGEIIVKAQYMNCMQDYTKLYWEKKKKQYHCHDTHNCASMSRCNVSS